MAQVSKRALTSVCLLVTFALLVPTASSEVSGSVTDKKPDLDTSKVVAKPPEDNSSVNNTKASVQKPSAASDTNCTNTNDTACGDHGADDGYFKSLMKKITENRDMLLRTMYVLFGVTGVIIIYFIARAWRLRRKRNKSRKYGVITTRGDLEMEPLGRGDEEDEDYTVFEMNGRHK